MDEHDRTEFVTAIAAMAATFRQEGSESVYEGYWMGLSDLDLETVKGAVKRGIRESRWMPTPHELRILAGEMSLADRALKAWGVVQRAVKRHGCWRSVNFDDAVVNAAIRNLGGWKDLDDRIDEGQKWTRKEFIEVYESLCRTGIAAGSGDVLIGFNEYDNRYGRYVRPYALPEPVQIPCGLPPHRPGIVPALENKPRSQIEFIDGVVTAIGNAVTTLGQRGER